MRRWLAALMLTAGTSFGQVVVLDHNTGQAIATPLVLPDVPVNDFETLALDVVNMGTASVTVTDASVSGLYYSLCCDSGFVLPPGQSQSLTLQFAPSAIGYMTGALHIDDQAYFIFGRAVPAASLFFQTPAGPVQAHTGAPLVLTTSTASNGQLSGFLRNDTDTVVSIDSLTVTGDWILATMAPAALQLNPGDQTSVVLSLAASPRNTSFSGIIQVNQWAYAIDAHAPTPAITLQVSSSPLMSGKQVSLSIAFDQAPDSVVTGTVNLTLETSGPITLSDPGVLFTATGTGTASFSSVPGQTSADFGGQSTLTFQTGTTAGTLHFQAVWSYSDASVDIPITAAPVTIESITGTRESNALDLTLKGFDNTRTAGRFSFSFFDSQGAFIGTPVTADFSELFYDFFFQQEYNAGGMFEMKAHFPVSGDTSQINSVQVDVLNTAGDAQSSVIPFH